MTPRALLIVVLGGILVSAAVGSAVSLWGASAAPQGAGPSALASAPETIKRRLGSDPITVTVSGNLLAALAPPRIDRLAAFEDDLSRVRGVQAVYGPASFLRDVIAGMRRAMSADLASGGPKVTRADLLARLGSVGAPSLDNQDLMTTVVFGAGITPKRDLRWLFPDPARTFVFVRPAAGVTGGRIVRLAETATRLAAASGIDGVRVLTDR
jgi:hypothetical protein